MSSIDDTGNGAQQTRYHRNPPEECGRAVRLVCSYAHDAADARELCTALGLNPRDGRRKPLPRVPSVPGRPSIRAPLGDTSSRRPIGPPPSGSLDVMPSSAIT